MQHADLASLPRIGGMATIPSRNKSFLSVVDAILPQLDRLYVFFDRYDGVPPEFSGHKKIVALHPSQIGDFGSCGKFLGLELFGAPCLYFGFDDDIHYPSGYVGMMSRALRRHNFRALIGVHGLMFAPPYQSYFKDRQTVSFAHASSVDCFVDELGAGTMAFFSGCIRFHPRDWPHRNMADLMLGIEAVKQSVPKIIVRRPANYMTPIPVPQDDTLYARLMKDDSKESEIMKKALADYPYSWQRSVFDGVKPSKERLPQG